MDPHSPSLPRPRPRGSALSTAPSTASMRAAALGRAAVVASLVALASFAPAPAVAARPAADLAAEPTPVTLDRLAFERLEVSATSAKARERQRAAWGGRRDALVAARARSPMARNGASRDHEIADLERDLAMLRWHERVIACEAAPGERRARGCADVRLDVADAIDAYRRVLAERPQHRRRDEVRIALASLQLRTARDRNDVGMALEARAALERLERELPASTARLDVAAALAEDDALLGRVDLAEPRWRALAQARPPHPASAYAAYRLGWAQWHDDRHLLAIDALGKAAASARTASLRGRASADQRWMLARVKAAEAAAAAPRARRARQAAEDARAAAGARAASAAGKAGATGEAGKAGEAGETGEAGEAGEASGAGEQADREATKRDRSRGKRSSPTDKEPGAPAGDEGRWPRRPAPR